MREVSAPCGTRLYVSQVTVNQVRKTYVEQGLEKAINRKKPEREYEHRLDGEAEAYLIALACSEAPDGQERWTLRLLRDHMIQLKIERLFLSA